MKLREVKKWECVHIGSRGILPQDKNLYPIHVWENLLDKEVVKDISKNHYRVVEK